MALVKRTRPVRDSIGAVSNTIATTARVISGVVELADIAIANVREDLLLDNYEEETERLVRRAELEKQRAELLPTT